MRHVRAHDYDVVGHGACYASRLLAALVCLLQKHTITEADLLLSAGRHSCVAAVFACPCVLATLLWPLQHEIRMRSRALNVEPILLPMRQAPACTFQVVSTEAT